MPIEPVPAKYANIADAVQQRIERGTYPPGSMLPSESQLVREFDASRSTVVRALEYLRQLGYLEGVQGKGRLVLGTRPRRRPSLPRRLFDALHAAELTHGTVIGAGGAPASSRIATMLAIPVGESVVARQRVMQGDGTDCSTLSTVYLPAVAAIGTGFADAGPLREGALDHLERCRRLAAADVIERLSARPATARESTLLTVDPGAVVLTNLLVVRSAEANPLLIVDLARPLPSQGIEEIFSFH
ncbi:GntR family transcriptional regulator [Actinoplanes sp. L3-i22]|uniref:GntR family transcriptional regulator n=1 Tax=Actinoplanes sp. L3-i22 TaxID=2836373 RepID=UPI001C85DE8E|nr:GntR family transcriptional regulator [Actinoplanes sp. L3-i22]